MTKLKRKHRILLIDSALLVLCAFIGTASAALIYIPDEYAKIQWAVDNATDGDTIIVRDGTYIENINIYKRLTIRSENGSENCIVQAYISSDHVFEVTADYVNINGFTVTTSVWNKGIYLNCANHSNISENNAKNNYYGIYLYSSNNNMLTGNTASNNEWGIYLYSSNDNTLNGNTASNDDYGIWLRGNNNTLIDNTASNNDNGIRLFSSSNDNTLNGNTASNDVFGIMLEGNDNTLNGNTASNNEFGIMLGGNDNTLNGNTASNNDYGIWLGGNNNTLIDNTFNSNYWHGIYLYSSDDNMLTGNTASDNEIGICLWHSSNDNMLTGNTASNNDYGIWLGGSSNNLIYNNYFNNTINAVDPSGIGNIWNITKTEGTNIIGGPYLGGNYWSDYTGMDIDGDGLGETSIPYNRSGDINNSGDYLPLIVRTPQTATTDIKTT